MHNNHWLSKIFAIVETHSFITTYRCIPWVLSCQTHTSTSNLVTADVTHTLLHCPHAMWSFHMQYTLSAADVKSAPGGPFRKEAQHLPFGHTGTIRPRNSSGRLLGTSATQSVEKQKQATWEALLSLLHKSQGKRKHISYPYTPADLHVSHHLRHYNK